MGLEEYRKKRRSTAEPRGGDQVRARDQSLAYVIQKHQASHLHYDFRLEWDGVLLSWAVPKGPSLDPAVKRLAMRVEDHPVEYAGFEGVISADEYGGGTVMVWDRGSWTPEVAEVNAALRKGDLKFTLNGAKLKGSWVLVRTRGNFAGGKGASWLLIKHRDRFASANDITLEEPRSALTRRSLAEIARAGGGNVEKAAAGDGPDFGKAKEANRQPGLPRRPSRRRSQ